MGRLALMLMMMLPAFAGGAGVAPAVAAGGPNQANRATMHLVSADISISGQMTVADLATAKSRGFKAVADLRPDGEAADQTSSSAMKAAADAAGLRFAYIPVGHGDIPATSVAELARFLADAPAPALVYCSSGRRAARTWALMEASRKGGLSVAAIEAAAQHAGQPVDALHDAMVARVAAREQAVDQ